MTIEEILVYPKQELKRVFDTKGRVVIPPNYLTIFQNRRKLLPDYLVEKGVLKEDNGRYFYNSGYVGNKVGDEVILSPRIYVRIVEETLECRLLEDIMLDNLALDDFMPLEYDKKHGMSVPDELRDMLNLNAAAISRGQYQAVIQGQGSKFYISFKSKS
ncbi:MAG: hypothetical protein V1859_00840 [archaeon]